MYLYAVLGLASEAHFGEGTDTLASSRAETGKTHPVVHEGTPTEHLASPGLISARGNDVSATNRDAYPCVLWRALGDRRCV